MFKKQYWIILAVIAIWAMDGPGAAAIRDTIIFFVITGMIGGLVSRYPWDSRKNEVSKMGEANEIGRLIADTLQAEGQYRFTIECNELWNGRSCAPSCVKAQRINSSGEEVTFCWTRPLPAIFGGKDRRDYGRALTEYLFARIPPSISPGYVYTERKETGYLNSETGGKTVTNHIFIIEPAPPELKPTEV